MSSIFVTAKTLVNCFQPKVSKMYQTINNYIFCALLVIIVEFHYRVYLCYRGMFSRFSNVLSFLSTPLLISDFHLSIELCVLRCRSN